MSAPIRMTRTTRHVLGENAAGATSAPYLRRVTRRPLLVIAAALALTTACGGSDAPTKAVTAAAPSPIASPSASPSPSPSPTPTLNPLTGLAGSLTEPVVVVKIDNGGLARPYHRGLDRAAIVYQELVESGETRFAAVYTDGSSAEVGPVRSVRDSDIELLRQYGKVPVGFSGGNTGVKASFAKAVRAGQLLDASYDAVPSVYRLAERRADARNFFTSPAALAASRPGDTPRDIGLHFAPLPAGVGTPAVAAKAVFSKYVTVTARYAAGRWSIAQNGRTMPKVSASNVVVQYVPVKMSKYVDVLGNPTPYTVTVGSGPVTVLRDGQMVKGTWSRPTASAGTRFLDATGKDIPLKPGATWVLLLPKGQPVSVR